MTPGHWGLIYQLFPSVSVLITIMLLNRNYLRNFDKKIFRSLPRWHHPLVDVSWLNHWSTFWPSDVMKTSLWVMLARIKIHAFPSGWSCLLQSRDFETTVATNYWHKHYKILGLFNISRSAFTNKKEQSRNVKQRTNFKFIFFFFILV